MCSGNEYVFWEVTAPSGMIEPEARAAGARMRSIKRTGSGTAAGMKNISMEICDTELIFLN